MEPQCKKTTREVHPCAKCGRHPEKTRYFEFFYGKKAFSESTSTGNVRTTRTGYVVRGSQGGWICPSCVRRYASLRVFGFLILLAGCLAAIPFILKMDAGGKALGMLIDGLVILFCVRKIAVDITDIFAEDFGCLGSRLLINVRRRGMTLEAAETFWTPKEFSALKKK